MKIYYTAREGGEWLEFESGGDAGVLGEISKEQCRLTQPQRWVGKDNFARVRIDSGTLAYSLLFPNDSRFDAFLGWDMASKGCYASLCKNYPKDLEPGQVWYDKDRKWTDGSNTLDGYHVLLSRDLNYSNPSDRTPYWATATFFRLDNKPFMGAKVRHFTDDDVRMMQYIGDLNDIIKETE